MSLQIKKEDGSIYDPVFLQIITDIPGGVTVATDRFPTDTKEIKKGALLNDGGSGLFNIIKTVKTTAYAVSGATVLAIVPPDHLFKVGEKIFLKAAAASTITRVSSTAIAITAVLKLANTPATDTVLYETAAAGASAAKYDADCILRDTIQVRDEEGNLLENLFAGAVVRGEIDESELPYFVTDQQKTDLTARIRFS